MQLRHILAVVDFSTDAGINAAWRAAHLARAHQSELCLLSLVELADKHPGSRFGATAPPARARSDLLHLASHMRDTLNIFPAVIVGVGPEGRDMLTACARRADLVVLAPASRLADRLVTECGVPVLTARQASHHARRSALVVHEPRIADLQPLLDAAQWLCKPDGIHALKLLDRRLVRLLQAADQPLPAIHDRSQIAQQRAQLNLQTELARAGLRHTQGAVLAAVNGSRLLQQQMRLGATVVVLGQQRQSSWLAWLQPSLARQFSRQAACDVLIVPDRLPTAKEARWTLNRGRQEGALRLEH